MTLKQILSFFAGLLITVIVYFSLLYVAVDFVFYEPATLVKKEKQDAILFYSTLLVVAGSVYIIIRFFKSNRRFTAIGMCLPVLFSLYVLFLLGQSYADNLNYYQPFDKSKWIAATHKPFKMAKTLTKSKSLIGKSRQEINELLGNSHNAAEEPGVANMVSYYTDNGAWILMVYFDHDKVTDSSLMQDNSCL